MMFTAGDPDHTSEPRAVIHVAVVNLDVILSEDAKEYLTEAFGDLEEYITALIEATVKRVKNGSVA